MKPLFSVVLIARNESKTLPRLIESLHEFKERGGEIVLVDTGSTDGTADIARANGCKVEEVGTRFLREITEKQAYSINRFLDHKDLPIVAAGDTLFDYAGARNFAAGLASYNVVAMPDCDEIYTKLDIDKINKAIEGGIEQFEYNFVFAHDDFGGDLVKFLHSKFYDRRKLKWQGIIHEVLQGEAIRHRFGEETIKLEHWQNPDTNRGGYLKGLALAVLEDPANDRNSHYFGRELLYSGRPRSAMLELKRHISMGKWPEERSQSQVHIGEAHMALGEVEQAIHAWVDAFDTCATRREPLMKIAEYYRRMNSAPHVLAYASAALEIPRNNFYASYHPYYEHVPHELLYWAYWLAGDKVKSLEHFLKAFEYQPYNSAFLRDVRWYEDLPKISILIPTMRPAGLDRVLKSIKNLNYPQDKLEIIVLHDGTPDTGLRHDGCLEYFSKERNGVPITVALGVKAATGDWIVYAADDMEFHPDCIIAALRESGNLEENPHSRHLLAFNGGPLSEDKGNICEHFMIHRVLLEGLPKGEIFDTDFHHVGVDNLLWARMEKAREALRCEQAHFTHHHFSRGAEMDDVHKIGWEPGNVAADRALLQTKLAQL